jgi:hypothetical protein
MGSLFELTTQPGRAAVFSSRYKDHSAGME